MKRVATIAVHAFDDQRVHLAPARRGHLRQGRLKTLCGRQAVTELSPFAAAGAAATRCRTCFARVDADGMTTVETPAVPKASPKAKPASKPAARTEEPPPAAATAAAAPRRNPPRRVVARSGARQPLRRPR